MLEVAGHTHDKCKWLMIVNVNDEGITLNWKCCYLTLISSPEVSVKHHHNRPQEIQLDSVLRKTPGFWFPLQEQCKAIFGRDYYPALTKDVRSFLCVHVTYCCEWLSDLSFDLLTSCNIFHFTRDVVFHWLAPRSLSFMEGKAHLVPYWLMEKPANQFVDWENLTFHNFSFYI